MRSFRLSIIFILVLLFSALVYGAISPIDANTKVYFADVNNDGLLDVIVGNFDKLEVYLNTGTASSPSFGTPSYTVPLEDNFDRVAGAFCDIDYDGDFDLFFGTQPGTVAFRKNVGTPSSPDWSQLVNSGKTGDSYNNIDLVYRVQVISFIDFDGDGDQDMVINDVNSTMYYWLNQDRESDGWVDGNGVSWVPLTGSSVPISGCGGDSAKHHWTDWDGDGDFDVISGIHATFLTLYKNDGSPFDYSNFAGGQTILSNVIEGKDQSIFFEDFNNDGFMDLFYTNDAGNLTLVSAVNRSGSSDVDDAPPVLASNGLQISSVQANTIVLKWPYVYDSSASSYRSGIKYYALYRSDTGPDFTPDDQTNLLWKHYQMPHFPDYVPEIGDRGGDGFKIEGGDFYYKDANLPGGSTFYYKLKVVDYAGNSVTTDSVQQFLAPPEFTSVDVSMTPSQSANDFTLKITTLDQYGMQFPISPPSTNPNVVISVYEGGSPSGSPLIDADTGGQVVSATFNNESSKSFHVTYKEAEQCVSFVVHVDATDVDSTTKSGDATEVLIDRLAPPLPGNLSSNDNENTTSSITVRWNASSDACTSVSLYHVYYREDSAQNYQQAGTTSDLYFTINGLTVATTYHVYVTAEDVVGNETQVSDPDSVAISVATHADDTPPTAPTGLSATYTNNNSQILISWNASTDDSGIDKYEVQKKDGDDAFFVDFKYVNVPETSCVDNTSYPGHPIYYRVRAFDIYGNVSDWSTIATADVNTDHTPPTIPTGLVGNADGPYSISLNWNSSTDSESGVKLYRIYRNYSYSPIAESTTTSYTDSGLSPDTDYSYQVSAVDNAGNESGKSTSITVHTSQDPTLLQPNPPTNLHATESTYSSVSLKWTAPASNGAIISQYRIYKHASDTSPVGSGTVVGVSTQTSATVSGLQSATVYYFTVTAVSDHNVESEHSNRISVSTLSQPPSVPGNFHVVKVSSRWVDLAWDSSTPPPGKTIESYVIYLKTSSPFGSSYSSLGSTTNTSYRVENLDPETNYSFAVRAKDSSGVYSDYSDPVQVKTYADDSVPPPAPSNLKGNPLDSHTISLTWDAVSDNEGGTGLAYYEVFRDGNSVATTTAPNYKDEGLDPLTTYTYTVRAVDNADNKSPLSDSVDVTTYGETNDLFCAHVASTTDWETSIAIVNTGTEDNPVYFYAIDASGNLTETHTLDSLPAGSSYVVNADDLFSAETFNKDIWVKVSSLSSIEGVLTFGTRDNQTMVTIPMFDTGASDLIFPYVYSSDIYYTGITLINTSTDMAAPFLYAYSETGDYLTSKVVSIPAGGKYVRLVSQIFDSSIDPNQIRFIRVESDKTLIGFELFGTFLDKGLAGLPAFSPTVDLFKLSQKRSSDKPSHDGNHLLSRPSTPTGFQGVATSSSEIYLSWNPNPESDLDHYDVLSNDYPTPSLIAHVTDTNYTVSGLSADTTYRYSLKAVNSAGEESAATSQIAVTTLPEGQHDYPYHVYYNEIPDKSFYFTGVTFTNLGTDVENVHMEAYDKDGNKLAESDNAVSKLEQKTRKADDFFDGGLPDGTAYLKAGSDEKMLGFELYLTLNIGTDPFQFDGIIGVETGSTRLDFPLIKTGNDWDTLLKLTNTSAKQASFTIHAYGADGTELTTYDGTIAASGCFSGALSDLFPDNSDNIAWVYVEADQQMIGDAFYVSSDLTRLSSYMGIKHAESATQ